MQESAVDEFAVDQPVLEEIWRGGGGGMRGCRGWRDGEETEREQG